MCGSGISSHIIVCMWNLSGFLCNNPKCPGVQGRRSLCQSHLGGTVFNCAIWAVAPYWDCFSLLRSYQAWSNQLTCDKNPDIRQTSRPKTAGTKLPKGPISRDEGDFLTLQEGPRKGFSPAITKNPCRSILTLSRAVRKSCVLATHGLHIVFQYSSQ